MTANHILGHFFVFVAMGISVFHSFVFCEKKEYCSLPQLAHQNVLRMRERGVVVSQRVAGENLSAGGRLQGHFV